MGIEVAPLAEEVLAHSELWELDASRQKNIAVQRETQAIALFVNATQAILDTKARTRKPISYRGRATPHTESLPLATAFARDLTAQLRGRMGRAVVVRLRPNGRIYPHTDYGLYWLLRDRYHLVVRSVGGSRFRADSEHVHMLEGELWWFDPTVEHEAFNESDQDRIHVIVDVLSLRSLGSFLARFLRAPARATRAVGGGVLRTIASR